MSPPKEAGQNLAPPLVLCPVLTLPSTSWNLGDALSPAILSPGAVSRQLLLLPPLGLEHPGGPPDPCCQGARWGGQGGRWWSRSGWAVHMLVWASQWGGAGRRVGHARGAAGLSPQSQPLSFTMCDISMMYFPSLYFWLVSKACS